ncbi:hypothetical protein HDZ31DRAFT_73478 [Schizophyllum fasciatum]
MHRGLALPGVLPPRLRREQQPSTTTTAAQGNGTTPRARPTVSKPPNLPTIPGSPPAKKRYPASLSKANTSDAVGHVLPSAVREAACSDERHSSGGSSRHSSGRSQRSLSRDSVRITVPVKGMSREALAGTVPDSDIDDPPPSRLSPLSLPVEGLNNATIKHAQASSLNALAAEYVPARSNDASSAPSTSSDSISAVSRASTNSESLLLGGKGGTAAQMTKCGSSSISVARSGLRISGPRLRPMPDEEVKKGWKEAVHKLFQGRPRDPTAQQGCTSAGVSRPIERRTLPPFPPAAHAAAHTRPLHLTNAPLLLQNFPAHLYNAPWQAQTAATHPVGQYLPPQLMPPSQHAYLGGRPFAPGSVSSMMAGPMSQPYFPYVRQGNALDFAPVRGCGPAPSYAQAFPPPPAAPPAYAALDPSKQPGAGLSPLPARRLSLDDSSVRHAFMNKSNVVRGNSLPTGSSSRDSSRSGPSDEFARIAALQSVEDGQNAVATGSAGRARRLSATAAPFRPRARQARQAFGQIRYEDSDMSSVPTDKIPLPFVSAETHAIAGDLLGPWVPPSSKVQVKAPPAKPAKKAKRGRPLPAIPTGKENCAPSKPHVP